jgi:hypothetical protein
VVMRLSGRQVEHGKDYTLEGLLAGVWVLLAMATLLQWMSDKQIYELADFVLNGSVPSVPASPCVHREAG